METSRDYSSIVHSPPFTFLVGPRHTKLTVQSGLARHVSKPLDHLMNSGQTRESKHHTAVLEDEDVETFVAFCEYAYTGDYSVPPPGSRQDDRESVSPVTRPVFQRTFTAEDVLSPTNHTYLPSPPQSAEASDKDADRHVAVDEARRRDEPKVVGVGEDVKDGVAHVSAAPGEGHAEEVPVSEEGGDQPSTDVPDGDVDPWDMAGDAVPSKGKKGKKKKDKKKQKDEQADNLTTKLTPPTTPPPDNMRDSEVRAEDAPERDNSDDMGENETSPFDNAAEHTASGPSPGTEDGWEVSAGTTTPSGNDTATPDPETADQVEDGNHEVERTMGPIIDTSFAKQHFSSHHEKGIGMWDEFASLNYVDPRGYSSTRPPSVLSTQSSRAELPYLVFHAKLYVFAARYLIPALAQLCLRKLHRDLVNLGFPDGDAPDRNADDDEAASLTTIKAKMVLDLLHYTYTKTTRLEPISPAAATQLRDNELRKLVIHYAACKVRDLAECCPPMEGDYSSLRYPVKPSARGMRALLDATPELASDLVYRMM